MSSQPSSLPFKSAAEAGEARLSQWLSSLEPPDLSWWDELRDAQGQVRESWQRFFGWLGNDPAELDRDVSFIAQQIRDDGITYNVYRSEGESTAARPWSLELFPLLITPEDWSVIERGVVQRAALLNAMMADLYGPQRLLHEGLLPPALLFLSLIHI